MSFLSSCTSGGCGAKIDPGMLAGILNQLPRGEDERLLVGFSGSDDAAVYQVSDDTALVSTVDFFPPMVEDPFLFGEIAAANALSDIYAMGGTPLYALNLTCYPQKADSGPLADILAGGVGKVLEAGAVIAGGHSIYDHEPKYGLAVTGRVDPRRLLRNNTCRAGDALLLTKALGAGLVLSALRGGEAAPAQQQAAFDSMRRLNRWAAEKLQNYPVSACTDVTGFGLAVHAAEMAGTEHTLVIDGDSLPVLPGALAFAGAYLATAAGQRNRNFMAGKISMRGISPALEELLFDPQTSGGLLVSLPAAHAQRLCDEIQRDDPAARIIGEVVRREQTPVVVV